MATEAESGSISFMALGDDSDKEEAAALSQKIVLLCMDHVSSRDTAVTALKALAAALGALTGQWAAGAQAVAPALREMFGVALANAQLNEMVSREDAGVAH